MKKIFLFSLLLSLPLVLMAAVGIKDGGKYRIVCQKYATGCLVLGERHDKAPLLFYDTEGTEVPTDAWWVVSKRGGGYTFRNAATGEFMVYKEGKVKNEAGLYTAKGIQLSDAAKDDFAVWMIEPNDEGFATIENAGQTGQFFNLRMDGSFLLGTYGSAGSENGCFQLFDEKGAPAITAGGEEEVRPTDSGPSPTRCAWAARTSLTMLTTGSFFSRSPTRCAKADDWQRWLKRSGQGMLRGSRCASADRSLATMGASASRILTAKCQPLLMFSEMARRLWPRRRST